MPRFLARLPYGARTDPLDAFAFEEDTERRRTRPSCSGATPPSRSPPTWCAPSSLYGWCSRIRGIDRGGVVEGLPVLHHPTADGDVDRRTVTEICLSERREAELAGCGLIPLVHRKNTDVAAFISANSLQKPRSYDDPDATANANLSARLPYLFASCRFAHYLKCMVRDKVGSTDVARATDRWLNDWIIGYVDGSPATSSEEFKAGASAARRPGGRSTISRSDPGEYDAKFFITPHYQLEGASVVLRLVSNLAAS